MIKSPKRKSPIKGGKRTLFEKLSGPKCDGIDPITHDKISDINSIRLLENGHYYCFDILSLKTWINMGRVTNPYTNLNFSLKNLDKIKRKIKKTEILLRPLDLSLLKKYSLVSIVIAWDPSKGYNKYKSINGSCLGYDYFQYQLFLTHKEDDYPYIEIYSKNYNIYQLILNVLKQIMPYEPTDTAKDGGVYYYPEFKKIVKLKEY